MHLFHDATIITVDASRRVLVDGALLVDGNTIVAVGKRQEVQQLPAAAGATLVSLQHRVVLPGLINSHVHLLQSVMRGLAENLGLHDWASCAIWPLEVAFGPGDGAIAARLTVAEMLKTGTTCFLEPMLPSYGALDFAEVAAAVGTSGIRGCLGKLVKVHHDVGKGIRDDRDAFLGDMTVDAAIAAHEKHHAAYDGRLHVWMAGETPRGQDEAGFAAIGAACAQHGIRYTLHCAEAAADRTMIRQHYHATPGEFCRNVGAVGPHVVLGHMVHLDATDYALLAASGTHVAHNPTSNAKLADGIAPVPQLLSAGVNVCLGTDGAPCNNAHDIFRDMHLAGILHKGRHEDPSLLSAETVLEMATINAARALGVEDLVGSLEPGKRADFVVVDASGLHAAPYDAATLASGGLPVSTVVVHSLGGADVRMVVVDGRVVVEEGRLLTMDEEQVKADARAAIGRMRAKSGVKAQPLKAGWHYE